MLRCCVCGENGRASEEDYETETSKHWLLRNDLFVMEELGSIGTSAIGPAGKNERHTEEEGKKKGLESQGWHSEKVNIPSILKKSALRFFFFVSVS